MATIRDAEIRTGSSGGASWIGDGRNFDKHWGKAVCYITVGTRNIYWWTRITVNTAIDLRENTDPCSEIKQYQIIREEPITLDLESMIPGPNNTTAQSYLADFKPGTIIAKLYSDLLSGILVNPYGDATESAYGAFVVERSNTDINRDDFATLRVTLRSLGYGTNTVIDNVAGDSGDICPISSSSSSSS
jgi:hypothetical protein